LLVPPSPVSRPLPPVSDAVPVPVFVAVHAAGLLSKSLSPICPLVSS